MHLFCRFCYRSLPSDKTRRRHESSAHNSEVDANKLKNSAPDTHVFIRCKICRIYTSSTEADVISHAGSEHHKRAVLAVNSKSIKAVSSVGSSSSTVHPTYPPVARGNSEASIGPSGAGVMDERASYGWPDVTAAGMDAAIAEMDSSASAFESASAENDLLQVDDVTSSSQGADGQSGGNLCVYLLIFSNGLFHLQVGYLTSLASRYSTRKMQV
jgi:hypothetical protein